MAARRPSVDLSSLPPPPECAHIGCKYPAIVKIKNSNLCHSHYVALGNVSARECAARNKLQSVEDHRKFCRRLYGDFGNPRRDWRKHWQEMLDNPASNYTQRTFAEAALRNLGHGKKDRIPGEDDEPLTAFEISLEERAAA